MRHVHACIHVPSDLSKHVYICICISAKSFIRAHAYLSFTELVEGKIHRKSLIWGKSIVSRQVSNQFIDSLLVRTSIRWCWHPPPFRRRTLEVSTLLREMFHEYRDAYNCRRDTDRYPVNVCTSANHWEHTFVAAWWIYPLVNVYITMENHHAING